MDMDPKGDWRSRFLNLADQMWFMRVNRIKTDLIVNVTDKQHMKAFDCHKIFLVRLSSVFETLISESEANGDGITISAVQPDLFLLLLKFAYFNEVKLSSVTEALSLRNLCTKYDVRTLKKFCEQFVHSNLDTDSIWDILDEPNKPPHMTAMWSKFLFERAGDCLRSERFLSCSQATLLMLLKAPWLAIDSELDVVKAVRRWTERCNHRQPLDGLTSRRLLGPCLKYVRFLALTPVEFSENVASSGLLCPEENLAVLVHLNSPGVMALPDFICTETVCRGAHKPQEDDAACTEDLEPTQECEESHSVDEKKEEKEDVTESLDKEEATESLNTEEEVWHRNIDAKIADIDLKKRAKKQSEDYEVPERRREASLPPVAKMNGNGNAHDGKTNGNGYRSQTPPDSPRKQVSRSWTSTTSSILRLICFRDKINSLKGFTELVETPATLNMGFVASRRLTIIGLKLMTQVNQSKNQPMYFEELFIELLTEKTMSIVRQMKFGKMLEYGPAPHVIMLSSHATIEGNKPYILRITFKSEGKYLNECRKTECYPNEDTKVSFSSMDVTKGLLHSLIFQA